jgi:hypothetical protein
MKKHVARLLWVAVAMGALPAWSALEIEMADGCPQGVVDTSPQPNCPENAACRSRGGTVHWQRADRGGEFSLNFNGAESQIFANWGQGSCQSTSTAGGQLVCEIADDAPTSEEGYKYDVEADGCVLDPRLIIR